MTVDGLEKERDFYFGKLRDIEVMCQDCDNTATAPIIQKILDVLYATEVIYILFNFFYFHKIKKFFEKSCVYLVKK